jgi:hypothetical protein
MWTLDKDKDLKDFLSFYYNEEWKSFYESSICPYILGGIA